MQGQNEGVTPSERYLARLARTSFLSLWSHSNLYTDEGRKGGKGAGKELADLLVVFGDHVLIFSDKHCAFPRHPDINTSWRRWYTAAVEKSARQLIGAQKWLERFPQRVFKDSRCASPFPLALPTLEHCKFYLIAVTNGSHGACQSHFGSPATGSLMVCSNIRGEEHYQNPFCIGHVRPDGPFIHVLDEMTIDVLMREFDTIADFTTYLEHRQTFLCTDGATIVATGEEDLVVTYSVRTDAQGRHSFPELSGKAGGLVIKEGQWERFRSDPRYKAKKAADIPSYAWDNLIELLIEEGDASIEGNKQDSEPYLRIMASETRLARRTLSVQMKRAFDRELPSTQRFVITAISPPPSRVVYLFVVLPSAFRGDSDAEYRDLRRSHLYECCHTAKLRFPEATQVVGIAREPLSERQGTFEVMFLTFDEGPAPPELAAAVHEMQADLGLVSNVVNHASVLDVEEFPNPDGRAIGQSPAKRLVERQRLQNLKRLRQRKG